MTRRQKIREIYNDLKDGLRFCELCETKNLNGEVVGYHQGISFSMGWDGRYIYVRNYGQWAVKATQKRECEKAREFAERKAEEYLQPN